MKHTPTKYGLARMFAEAARQIRNQSEMLSRLDSVGGDGDHGATMKRAMEALENAIEMQSAKSASVMLKDAGWAVMNVDGGASSALLGTFVSGMGSVEIDEELHSQNLADSFESGLRALMRQTLARVGDKTMMDALIPAVEAFRRVAMLGGTLENAMTTAAASAEAGAKSTSALIARYGRARSLGERTLGHADPGAVSISILFAGFRDALISIDEGDSHV
jgi:phosphoenolpyruvate---glycerone phosphotransferase subunit DhaL